MIHRRELLEAAMLASGAAWMCSDSAQSAERLVPTIEITDTNVSLFQWPFRRLPLDETASLVTKLRSLGISHAWTGSFEGIFHRDIAGVNSRLAETCEKFSELIPIGSINLELPAWEDDLRRCVEVHHMPGVRLHPNYHGYDLTDPRFKTLLVTATAADCFIQIAEALEDTRTQHPLVRVENVDLTPLPALLRDCAGAHVQILNGNPRGALLDALSKAPGISFDTARVEGTDGVAKLLQVVPRDRVMYGSHAPFLIPEAAMIRVHESGLDRETLKSLLMANAQQMATRSVP